MPKTVAILRLFVASPSDLAEERKLLEEVVDEYNLVTGDQQGVRLELVKWETHTRPGFGADPQDVINRQIGDNFDIFIGMMWTRFGTPTGRSESGTGEEFERAYSRLKEGPKDIPVMFYFKDAPLQISKIDPTQLAKVNEFKERLASEFGGLYHMFASPEDFQTKVRIHLAKLIQGRFASIEEPPSHAITTHPAITTTNPLVHFSALVDDEEEEGLYELSERANEAMANAAVVIKRIGQAIEELGTRANKRTAELNELAASGTVRDLKAAKRIADATGEDLELYVQRMAVEVPEFHKEHSRAMETFGKAAMLSGSDFKEPVEDVRNALNQLRHSRESSSTARAQIQGFRDAVAATPRMTSAFNRARKRAVAITDDFLSLVKTGEDQTREVETLLQGILDRRLS